MKDTKSLKSQSIGYSSFKKSLLRNISSWLLSAGYVFLAVPSILLATQAKTVFEFELADRISLQTNHCDLKTSLSRAFSLPLMIGANIEGEPCSSGPFRVDIDHDGDLDLIDLSDAPRVLVWVNNGRGRYIPLIPLCYNLVRACPYFYESAENDFLSLWVEPHKLCLHSVALGLVLKEFPDVFVNVEGFTPRSPRAPPAPMIKI